VDRWMSAPKAALLAIASAVLTRGLALRGLPAITCWSIATFSGSLAIFCGYSKGLVELTMFTGLFAAFGVTALSQGKGLALATSAMVLGLATHRAAAVLAPAWVVLVVWSARGISAQKHGRAEVVGSALTGIVTMAWSVSRIASTFGAVDRSHFFPAGDLFKSVGLTLPPLRLLDLGNTLLLMCPALPLLALIAGIERRPAEEEGPIRWLAVLALVSALSVLLVHPRQGNFRDWDLASAPGVAISFWVAAVVGTRLSRLKRSEQVGSAVVALVVSSTLIWM